MTRCTTCFHKKKYCTCWIPQLSRRCHWCFHFMDYCTCPDMVQARQRKGQTIDLIIKDELFTSEPAINFDKLLSAAAKHLHRRELQQWQQQVLNDMMRQYNEAQKKMGGDTP